MFVVITLVEGMPRIKQPHRGALCAHRHHSKHKRNNRVRRVRTAEGHAAQARSQKSDQQDAFDHQAPSQSGTRALPHPMDEHCHGHACDKEKRNGEASGKRARLALDKLRSGKNEASRHLRNENAEQAEIGAAVDVAGDDAGHDWDRPGERQSISNACSAIGKPRGVWYRFDRGSHARDWPTCSRSTPQAILVRTG